jgi:hypothetical protein
MPRFHHAVLAAALMGAGIVTAFAGDPLAVLRSELAKNPQAGKLVKSFPAEGGLTGVVLDTPGGQPMIAYVTPDGRYLVAGAIIDLANGNNLTAQAAIKEIGKTAIPNPEENAQTIYALGKMQGILFGNPQASSYLAVVVDPSTPKGKMILLESMNQAVALHNSGQDKVLQMRFYPYGPLAPKLLAGSNAQQLRNLLEFAEGKPLPTPTETAKTFASRNDAAAKEMQVKPPSMIVFDPNSQFTRAISLQKTGMSPGLVQSLAALQRSLAPSR